MCRVYGERTIPRHLAPTLARASARYPVLTLTGPRQSGKTTLLRHAFPDHAYASIEAPDERAFASEDPRGFLQRFSGPVILDEAQHVPALFSYVQVAADERGAAGQFVLSGSQNFLLLQRISQSLAGRAYIAHLLPFTLAELNRQPLRAGAQAVAGPPAAAGTAGAWTEHAARGFYPPVHDRRLPPFE